MKLNLSWCLYKRLIQNDYKNSMKKIDCSNWKLVDGTSFGVMRFFCLVIIILYYRNFL